MNRFRRLRIVEQMIIVMIFAVLTPMITSLIIINNVNQHAVRRELEYSASILSEMITKNIETFFRITKTELNNITLAYQYLPNKKSKDKFLNFVVKKSKDLESLSIISAEEYNNKFPKNQTYYYDKMAKKLYIADKINKDFYILAVIARSVFETEILGIIKDDDRQVYILDDKKNLVLSNNYSQEEFDYAMKSFPQRIKDNEVETYGQIKNQPVGYYKNDKLNLIVLVNTTDKITRKTINIARAKIITAIVISIIFIFTIMMIFTSYLYVNIKQLFKAVMALSKGNYKRKIRLLTNVLTPYEVVFLAHEFNLMIDEISDSYKQLNVKNKELKLLDNFRSNLIDTVSHEFRTPLTSILGYTSRLLREDIIIDDETKRKSLEIIKRQSERLSRMVEDLLVIPDIEGARLNIEFTPTNISHCIEQALLSVKNMKNLSIQNNISDNLPLILADKDRLEQVFINIFENAQKYAEENTDISIFSEVAEKGLIISVTNEAPYIPKEQLEKLFEKFTRIDDKTTRTTRGTGLGLYIVKGLVKSMSGNVELKSTKDNFFTIKIILPVVDNE